MTTTTPTTTDTTQQLIDGYFECWNAADVAARSAAIAKTWVEEATSSDPLNEVTGHDALAAMFAGLQDSYPGHSFRQLGESDTHHKLVRWGWEMLDPHGEVVLDGIDVALLADDGRIYYLAGFFGAAIPGTQA